MRTIVTLGAAALLAAAGPAFADPDRDSGIVTDAEIRSGALIDTGVEFPHIRPGTQYFEIHGSRRIARALGEDALPTALARGVAQPDAPRTAPDRRAAAW